MPDFNITLTERFDFSVTFGESDFEVSFGEVASIIDLPVYDGAYEVTPGPEAQTLRTADKTMIRDVVIGPVPDNYGLISWNGATLTVS